MEKTTTPIPTLAEDNLIEIFQYLNAKTLKKCTQVSKEWNRIIGSSAETMSKFKLKITGRWEVNRQIMKLQRNYRNVHIKSTEFNEKLVTLLKILAPNIRELEIEKTVFTAEHLIAIVNTSLQSLKIYGSPIDKVLEFAVKELKIRELSIEASDLPSEPTFYHNNPNKYLKTLKIGDETRNFNAFKGLLQVYPSLEKLKIREWIRDDDIISETLTLIARNCKKLKYLEISQITCKITPEMTIPTLTTLRVIYFDDTNNAMLDFCNSNPTIKELLLSSSFYQDARFINNLTTSLPKLKHLDLGYTPVKLTTENIGIFARNCINFELLEFYDRVRGHCRYLMKEARLQKNNQYDRSMWEDIEIIDNDEEMDTDSDEDSEDSHLSRGYDSDDNNMAP